MRRGIVGTSMLLFNSLPFEGVYMRGFEGRATLKQIDEADIYAGRVVEQLIRKVQTDLGIINPQHTAERQALVDAAEKARGDWVYNRGITAEQVQGQIDTAAATGAPGAAVVGTLFERKRKSRTDSIILPPQAIMPR